MLFTLQNFFQLQREDYKKIYILGIVFLLAGIAEMLNYTAFMSIFNTRIGPGYLPIMYLVEAILIPVEGWILSFLSQRITKSKFMTLLYAVFIVLGAINGIALLSIELFNIEMAWFYVFLFLSSNFVVRQQTLLMWSTAFDLSPTQQAKRLMPVFVLIAIVGGIISGILSSVLAPLIGSAWLYILGVAVLAAGLPNFINSIKKYLPSISFSTEEETKIESSHFYIKGIIKSPFLLLVVAIMTLMPALYFVMEYEYFTKAQETFVVESELTQFYGIMVIILFVAAFILQLISTKLMDKLGATTMIVGISIIFVGCFILSSLFIGSEVALIFASLGYAVLYLLLYYFAEPSYQFFFKMLPSQHRDSYRYMVQAIAASLGIMIGPILSLLHSKFNLSMVWLSIIGLALAVLLAVASWITKSLYMKQLVSNLKMTAEENDYFAEFWNYLRTDKFRKFFMEQLQSGTKTMQVILLELVRKQPDVQLDSAILGYALEESGDRKINALKAIHADTWRKMSLDDFEKMLSNEDAGVRAVSFKHLFLKGLDVEAFNDYLNRALKDEHIWVNYEAWRVMPQDELLYSILREQLMGQGTGALYAIEIVVDRQILDMQMDIMYGMMSEIQAVKLAAVRAIGKLNTPDIIPSFMELLIGADIELTESIKQALMDLAPHAKNELVRFIQSPQLLQWSIAIQVYRTVATDHELETIVVPSCLDKLAHIELMYSIYAEIVLTGQEQWVSLAKNRTDELINFQLDTIWDVMQAYSDNRAVEMLKKAINSEIEEVRDQGLEVLSEGFGDKRLNEALLRFYKRNFEEVNFTKDVEEQNKLLMDPWLEAIAIKAGAKKEEQIVMNAWEYLGSIEKVVFLKQVPLFENSSVEQLGRIASIAKERVYEEQSALFEQGEVSQTLFIVKSGIIEVSGENAEGIVGTLQLVNEKQSLGETNLFSQAPSRIAAHVLFGEATVLEIKASDMMSLIRLYPDIGVGLLTAMSQRLSNLEQMVLKLG